MHECANCGRKYTNPVALQRCPCGNNGGAQTISFVSDVLSAPVAVEPEPTDAAKELYAYNASVVEKGIRTPTIATPHKETSIDNGNVSYYSVYGQERLDEMLVIGRDTRNRMPVLLIGPTGGGKSRMIRDLCNKHSITYTESNAYPNMDVSLLFGMFRPNEDFMKDGLSWQDGLLTHAVSTGGAFFMEEVTRAPQDALGRFFPVTDNGFRTLPLMEKGELSREIPQDFWFVATANPATAGYAVQRMDKAFRSRFMIMRLDESVADEPRILDDILGNHPHREAFWKVVLEARNNPESYVNTRDIIMAARAIRGGIDPVRAIEMGISYKYDEFETAITNSANLHYLRVTENEQGGTNG